MGDVAVDSEDGFKAKEQQNRTLHNKGIHLLECLLLAQ